MGNSALSFRHISLNSRIIKTDTLRERNVMLNYGYGTNIYVVLVTESNIGLLFSQSIEWLTANWTAGLQTHSCETALFCSPSLFSQIFCH
jgi:hypothetical protein